MTDPLVPPTDRPWWRPLPNPMDLGHLRLDEDDRRIRELAVDAVERYSHIVDAMRTGFVPLADADRAGGAYWGGDVTWIGPASEEGAAWLTQDRRQFAVDDPKTEEERIEEAGRTWSERRARLDEWLEATEWVQDPDGPGWELEAGRSPRYDEEDRPEIEKHDPGPDAAPPYRVSHLHDHCSHLHFDVAHWGVE